MQEMHEKLRRFFEQVDASSAHAWRFWKQVPPLQVGDYIVKHTKDVVDALTTGDGDVRRRCIELAFVAFCLAEKHNEIINVTIPSIKNSPVRETMAPSDSDQAEADERARWHKKHGKVDSKPTLVNEPWRG